MAHREKGSKETLAKCDIGGVSVTLVRLNGAIPGQKAYQLLFEAEDRNHVKFVMEAIVNDLDRLGYNTRCRFDLANATLEFLPQERGTARVNPLALPEKTLGSIAISNVMKNLSQQYQLSGAIDTDLGKERIEQSISEDRYVMRMKSQKAGELLTVEEIKNVLVDSLSEHVTIGGHVVEKDIMSEAWQLALQDAANELRRRLIERVPINKSIGFK